jgi:hypothetical protein
MPNVDRSNGDLVYLRGKAPAPIGSAAGGNQATRHAVWHMRLPPTLPTLGASPAIGSDALRGQSSGLIIFGSVISTAPNPGRVPSMKNISTVMSGSMWAWDRNAVTFRPVSSLIVCL